MSKKQFIALADQVRWLEHKLTGVDRRSTAEVMAAYRAMLADFCITQNPAFNWARWYDYIDGKCGPNGGSPKKPKAKKNT